MAEVIGVRFKEVGKIYYFDPKNTKLETGDKVIVETARGIECGIVALPNKDVPDEEIIHPLKPLIRKANKNDISHIAENKKREKEALKICEKKIAEHGLEMNLVDVEYTFDNNKILFYFTADGRVDFRALVKDLARRRCSEDWAFAADRSAATALWAIFSLFPLKWQRSRDFRFLP